MAQAVNQTVLDGNLTATLDLEDVATLIPGIGDNALLTYVMLLVMAIVPIYVGAHRSLRVASEQREVMTHKDAMHFPLTASVVLVSLYIVFKYLGEEYIRHLLSAYFFLAGAGSAGMMLSSLLRSVVPSSWAGPTFHLSFVQENNGEATSDSKDDEANNTPQSEPVETFLDARFDYVDIAGMGLGAALSGLYIYTRHWLMNNLFAISFSISAIEMLSCNSFTIGAMLLSGLFFYDIFFVFGTDVMVTVAKSVQGPIKVVFPKDFLANGINSTMHGMLGLGDIVLPGIVIALMLRFDRSRKPTGSLYFSVAMLAYFLGLVTTMGVMHFFQAAQPALLYLSPAGVLAPLLTAFLRGETSLLFKYADEPESGTFSLKELGLPDWLTGAKPEEAENKEAKKDN